MIPSTARSLQCSQPCQVCQQTTPSPTNGTAVMKPVMMRLRVSCSVIWMSSAVGVAATAVSDTKFPVPGPNVGRLTIDVTPFYPGLCPQVGAHRQHAPVLLPGGGQIELAEDTRDVALDRALGDEQLLLDRPVGEALGNQAQHLALAVGQLVERVAAVAADHQGDDLRVERRATVGHAAHGLDEALDLDDAVLQQVADAVRA